MLSALTPLLANTATADATTAIHELVLFFVGVLIVSSVLALLLKRLRLPYTVMLVLLGIGLKGLAQNYEPLDLLATFKLDADFVLFVLLPVLLFEAAFNLDARLLMKEIAPILTLAIPAVLVSTVIIGVTMFALSAPLGIALPLSVALLFGALFSATDPVAVISVFKELGAPKRLAVLVEGESLFNDGTGFVVFITILGVITSGATFDDAAALHAVLLFLGEFFGGLLTGIVLGRIMSSLFGFVRHDLLIEISFTLLLAFGSFLVAQHFLHVSGVMATVGAALTLGNTGRTRITPAVLGPIEEFWEYLAFLANSLIFLLVGLSVDFEALTTFAPAIGAAFVVALLARSLCIYSLVPFVNQFRAKPIDRAYQHIMSWGGMRGALSLSAALIGMQALSEPEVLARIGSESVQFLFAVTLGTTILTIVIPGLTIDRLLATLGLTKLTPREELERAEAMVFANIAGRGRLRDLLSAGVIAKPVFDAADAKYEKQQELAREGRELLGKLPGADDNERETLRLHCLQTERQVYHDLFVRGDLAENVMKDLHHAIEARIDMASESGVGIELTFDLSPWQRLRDKLNTATRSQAWMASLMRHFGTARVARSYQEGSARLEAFDRVLVGIAKQVSSGATAETTTAPFANHYKQARDQLRRKLVGIADVFPEYVEEVQHQLAERLALKSQLGVLKSMAKVGLISTKVAKELNHNVDELLRKAGSRHTEELLVRPNRLLKRIPLFEDASDAEIEELARILQARSFLEAEDVVKQGELGDSMFLIGRGAVDILVSDGEHDERKLATLESGNFFGEVALLTSGPRTATVRTATPCGLLELRRSDLETICEVHPTLKERLHTAYRERVISATLAKIPQLSDYSTQQLEGLAQAMEVRQVTDGEIVVEAGCVFPGLLLVRKGKLSVVDATSRHPSELTELYHVGAASLTDEAACAGFTYSASGPCELLVLKQTHLADVL